MMCFACECKCVSNAQPHVCSVHGSLATVSEQLTANLQQSLTSAIGSQATSTQSAIASEAHFDDVCLVATRNFPQRSHDPLVHRPAHPAGAETHAYIHVCVCVCVSQASQIAMHQVQASTRLLFSQVLTRVAQQQPPHGSQAMACFR